MPISFWSEFSKHAARRLVVVWVLAFVGSAAFLALALFSLRAEALRAGERYAQSLVRLASEQTSRSFQTVGQALVIAETELADLAQGERLNEATARTDGVIRYDSDVGNIGVSLKDRDYFQARRSGTR
jgi:hypothetical protein